MTFNSIEEIVKKAETQNKDFYQIVAENEAEDRDVDIDVIYSDMRRAFRAMLSAVELYCESDRSISGLAGGDGALMEEYILSQKPISGDFLSRVIATALKMGECNACMKCIVAAPTAGSCGVLPAVMIPMYADGCSEESIINALITAGGIGSVIAARASIAGAAGGCQAEIGAASAMAAGALVSLRGGTPSQISNASAMALKNLMGLICDPVAGLVEVPCIKRNVVGAVNAISSADMALAGIKSHIPADEVIDVLGEVGLDMPSKYRETAKGGLATTPTGLKIKETMFENQASLGHIS